MPEVEDAHPLLTRCLKMLDCLNVTTRRGPGFNSAPVWEICRDEVFVLDIELTKTALSRRFSPVAMVGLAIDSNFSTDSTLWALVNVISPWSWLWIKNCYLFT